MVYVEKVQSDLGVVTQHPLVPAHHPADEQYLFPEHSVEDQHLFEPLEFKASLIVHIGSTAGVVGHPLVPAHHPDDEQYLLPEHSLDLQHLLDPLAFKASLIVH